ncbi:hypothetical protein HID58_034610 [Brassica napus]|uniref:Uncharacterized protein n=1 Tax=Brassica napus TaxID=3708 RepID=A0ABQ8C2L9_BRANA|nr:hypothetical protein HID58_034610 [Brassica napus]
MVKFHKALISRIEASSYCWNNRLCGPDMSSSFRVMAKSGCFLSKCQNIIPNYIEKLYEFDERLSQSTEKSKVERDAVHKAFIMSLFRLDTKESLTASFKHIGTSLTTDGLLRENFLNFIRDKVFPLKAELLKPQEEIERHMTDLIKKSLGDVSGEEFNMFMDFLRTLTSSEQRGAPGTKFLKYMNTHILPAKRKLDLVRALAEISPHTTAQVARQMLPEIVQLLKLLAKSLFLSSFTYAFPFEHIRSECNKQPSDRLGEDVSESYKEFTERLASVEDLTKATMKKLIQGTSEHNKAMSAAKTDKEKSSVKTKKQNATTGLRTCNNILAMTKVLHAKAPSFIGDKSVSLSWKEATKTLASTTTGVKRPATGAGNKDVCRVIRLLRKHLKESHTVVVEAVKEDMAEDREDAVVVVAVAGEEATGRRLSPLTLDERINLLWLLLFMRKQGPIRTKRGLGPATNPVPEKEMLRTKEVDARSHLSLC